MSQCTKELFGIYDDGREVYAYKLMDDKGQYVTAPYLLLNEGVCKEKNHRNNKAVDTC